MKITITKKHIEKGIRQGWSTCPIALACKDAGIKKVGVGDGEIVGKYNGEKFLFIVSDEIIEFIHNFDTGEEVKPFSFNLKI